MDRLDDAQWLATRDALLGDGSDELLELLVSFKLGRPRDHVHAATWSLAEELGWIDRAKGEPTEVGWLVADPAREYVLWLERGRALHSELEHPMLSPRAYEGRAVLEPGSGFGCNLFSLAHLPGRFVGLEPVDLYRQFTPILAAREGIDAPEVVGGSCESLPFDDDSFDVVLCYSAHQYMDLDPALREMARVLRPGGQLRLVGSTLTSFLRESVARLVEDRSLRRLKYDLVALGNTVAYELSGHRLVVPKGSGVTTAPIYPSEAFLRRRFASLGLRIRDELCGPIHAETCFVAEKAA